MCLSSSQPCQLQFNQPAEELQLESPTTPRHPQQNNLTSTSDLDTDPNKLRSNLSKKSLTTTLKLKRRYSAPSLLLSRFHLAGQVWTNNCLLTAIFMIAVNHLRLSRKNPNAVKKGNRSRKLRSSASRVKRSALS